MEIETGQVWHYLNRPGEEHSLALVGAVDDLGVPMPLESDMRCNLIAHVCMQQDAFEASITDLLYSEEAEVFNSVLKDCGFDNGDELFKLFAAGYQTFYKNKGDPFERGIAQVVDDMETVMRENMPFSRRVDSDRM